MTYNISPCLQKSILYLIFNFLKNNSYKNFLSIFDRKKELFDIILYISNNSILEIKRQAFYLLFLIDKDYKWNYLENKEIKLFVEKEVLNSMILNEINCLPVKNGIIDKKNELNLDEKENENIKKIKIMNFNEKNEIIPKENNNLGIKLKNEYMNEQISDKYDKKLFEQKLQNLYSNMIQNLYSNMMVFFYDNNNVFDLVVKIVSYGDLSLIDDLLSKIRAIIESPNQKKY